MRFVMAMIICIKLVAGDTKERIASLLRDDEQFHHQWVNLIEMQVSSEKNSLKFPFIDAKEKTASYR